MSNKNNSFDNPNEYIKEIDEVSNEDNRYTLVNEEMSSKIK